MNFGGILRSAFFAGTERVIVSAKSRYTCKVSAIMVVSINLLLSFCSCPLTPAVSKASAGAMEYVPVYSQTNMPAFLQVSVHTMP